MALIGDIRRRPWLILGFIALGVGMFIVMDIMTSGNGPVGGNAAMMMGAINGEKVDRNDFERTYSLLYGNSGGNTYANREQLWNYYIGKQIIKDEAEALGLAVSREELLDLQFGDNPSPIIRARFADPQNPQQLNRAQLDQIKSLIDTDGIDAAIQQGQLSPQFVEYWRVQEGEIMNERLQSKLVALVTKGMYVPEWQGQMAANELGSTVDLAYVKIPYESIADDAVSVSEDDLSAYLKEYRARYERDEESRVLEYVAVTVEPTQGDSNAIRTAMTKLASDFRNTQDGDSSFVLRNDGVLSPTFLTKDQVDASVADTIFSLPTGGVFGPYIEAGQMKVVKVIDRAEIADSADTRHILLAAQTPDQFLTAEQRIDSLKNVIESGQGDFATLASTFSEDPGSKDNGGKYENITPGSFVPEFDRVLFVTGRIGELYKVRTTYGWHLVEVLSRKGATNPRVKVAYLQEAIVPTKETQDEAFTRANEILANARTLEDLRKAARQAGLKMGNSGPLTQNAYTVGELGFGNDTRAMVCWAFAASQGEVSPSVYTFTDNESYYDNQYVIAGLRSVEAPGLPSVEAVLDQILTAVANRKKAEQIRSKISGNDLNAIANSFSVQVDTASRINLSMPFVDGIGNEPKVMVSAFQVATGAVSSPIEGTSGVFIIKPLTAPTQSTESTLLAARQQLARKRTTVGSTLLAALRDMADIEDNRAAMECSSL